MHLDFGISMLKKVLKEEAGIVSVYNDTFFLWSLSDMLVSHADDFAFCGDQHFRNEVIAGLWKRFLVNTHDERIF